MRRVFFLKERICFTANSKSMPKLLMSPQQATISGWSFLIFLLRVANASGSAWMSVNARIFIKKKKKGY